VPVVDGHLVTISVKFSTRPSESDLMHSFEKFSGLPQQRGLPSAPPKPVSYMPQNDRPQPRQDAERDRGMAAFVGRLRACPVLDYKFVSLTHNTIRGAAGAAVLNAELMHSEGMLD
jgi:aspartate-semialdehyde dehydrogenase